MPLLRPLFSLMLWAVFSVAHAAPEQQTFSSRTDLNPIRELASVQILHSRTFAADVALAAQAGFKYARFGIRWEQIDYKRQDKMDWWVDANINAFKAHGLTPIITLCCGNRRYGTPPIDSETEISAFVRYSLQVVKRYNAPGVMFEIWNEPNGQTFWGMRADGAGYARLAERVCAAIKTSAPDAFVLALAMEGTPANPEYLGMYRAFPDAALTPGLVGCADGFSFHPYRKGPPETYLADAPVIRAFLAGKGAGGKPIVLSEFGYPRTGSFDAQAQAAYAVRMLLIAASQNQRLNFYQFKSDDGYGLVSAAGTPYPIYYALQALLKQYGDYRVVEISETGARLEKEGAPPVVLQWQGQDMPQPVRSP